MPTPSGTTLTLLSPPGWLTSLHPLTVLHIDGYDSAVLRNLLKVISFDFTAIEHKAPHIIAIVVADTLSIQFALVVRVEITELVTDYFVEFFCGFCTEIFSYLTF